MVRPDDDISFDDRLAGQRIAGCHVVGGETLGGAAAHRSILDDDSATPTPSLAAARHQHIHPGLLGSVTDQRSCRDFYLTVKG